MQERDSFETILPLELETPGLKLWQGRKMTPFNLDGVMGVTITHEVIEFRLEDTSYKLSLDEYPFYINSPYTIPSRG